MSPLIPATIPLLCVRTCEASMVFIYLDSVLIMFKYVFYEEYELKSTQYVAFMILLDIKE